MIVLASGRDAAGVAPLLEEFDIRIRDVSLGPIPSAAMQQGGSPRFVDPSPILVESMPGDRVLYSASGVLLALAREVGSGSLVVIGDTRFVSTNNVEGMWGVWPGNVRFLLDLMTEYCGGSLGPHPNVFSPPPEIEGS